MIKTLEEINELAKAEKKVNLIIETKDYAFRELLEIARLSGSLNWEITFSNSSHLTTEEMIEMVNYSEHLTFDLR